MPDSIPSEHAVFIEPVAAACEILDQVKIPKGDPVALLGDGKLGLLIAQVLGRGGQCWDKGGLRRDKRHRHQSEKSGIPARKPSMARLADTRKGTRLEAGFRR